MEYREFGLGYEDELYDDEVIEDPIAVLLNISSELKENFIIYYSTIWNRTKDRTDNIISGLNDLEDILDDFKDERGDNHPFRKSQECLLVFKDSFIDYVKKAPISHDEDADLSVSRCLVEEDKLGLKSSFKNSLFLGDGMEEPIGSFHSTNIKIGGFIFRNEMSIPTRAYVDCPSSFIETSIDKVKADFDCFWNVFNNEYHSLEEAVSKSKVSSDILFI